MSRLSDNMSLYYAGLRLPRVAMKQPTVFPDSAWWASWDSDHSSIRPPCLRGLDLLQPSKGRSKKKQIDLFKEERRQASQFGQPRQQEWIEEFHLQDRHRDPVPICIS